MTDYTKRPDERPWSRELVVGDRLTSQQASVLQTHRLAELGITSHNRGMGRSGFWPAVLNTRPCQPSAGADTATADFFSSPIL